MTESTDLSELSGPGPNLAQVDPPHPFKAAIKTVVIAFIVMCIAIGLYVYLGQRPPVAAGEVLTMNLYPVHTLINSGGGSEGMQGSGEYYDQLLILVKIKVRNQTDIPLFLQDVAAKIQMPDGSEQVNVTVSDRDMDRVFQSYPSLGYLRTDPVHRDITMNPGDSVQGLTI